MQSVFDVAMGSSSGRGDVDLATGIIEPMSPETHGVTVPGPIVKGVHLG